MRELVPKATVIALLLNPNSANNETQEKDVREAARTLGLRLHILYAGSERDIDAAFAALAELRAGGLLVGSDTFLFSRRDQLIALAANHAVPTMYVRSEA